MQTMPVLFQNLFLGDYVIVCWPNHWLQLKLGTSQLEPFCGKKDSPKNKKTDILLGQLLFPNYFTIISLLFLIIS